MDAEFYSPRYAELLAKIAHSRFPNSTLGAIAIDLSGGATPSRKDESLYADSGIRFLRIQNLSEHGLILDDVKFITPDTHNGLLARTRLEPGDLLMTITGRIGTSAVVPSGVLPANINQHIVRIQLDCKFVEPQFVADWLNSFTGKALSNRGVTGTTRVALDYPAVRGITVPLPPLDIQHELIAQMQTARDRRSDKIARADFLLVNLDTYLLNELDVTPPPRDPREVFSVRLSNIRHHRRLNADYFHPERILAIKTLRATTSSRVADLVEFKRDQRLVTVNENYIGLAHVQSNTGELIPADEEASGQCFAFQTGDVLFARLRPYLNKVYRAEHNGVCSTEFHVMRISDPDQLIPDYLATMLRSSLIIAQTRHMMTGNTHPRLANDDVVNLIVPVPSKEVQQQIAHEVRHRREEARRLRADAEADWTAAKQRLEAQLLGNSQKPIS